MVFLPAHPGLHSYCIPSRLFHCVFCSSEGLNISWGVTLKVVATIHGKAVSVWAGAIEIIALQGESPEGFKPQQERNTALFGVILESSESGSHWILFALTTTIASMTTVAVFAATILASWFTAQSSLRAVLHAAPSISAFAF